MDSKKDVGPARGMLIKGISRAALNQNPKLMEILSFIVSELDRLFPEDNTNSKLN